MGLRRRGARAGAPSGAGRTARPPIRQRSAAAFHDSLARNPDRERDGRRARSDPAARSPGRRLPLRLRGAGRGHVLVPPAPAHVGADGARSLRRAHRRGTDTATGRSGGDPADRRLAARRGCAHPREFRRDDGLVARRTHRQLGDGQRQRGLPSAGQAPRAVAAAAGEHRERTNLLARAARHRGLDRGSRRPAPRRARAGRPDHARPGPARRSDRGRHRRGRRAGGSRFVRARRNPHPRHPGRRGSRTPGETFGPRGIARQPRAGARRSRPGNAGDAAHGRRSHGQRCARRWWTGKR